MNFQVPQFIEVEDKIFGPLTFRQFIYLAGGGGLAFVFYTYLPIYLSIFPIIGIIGTALALSFYKYNNRSLINILESAFSYHLGAKLYIWKKDEKKTAAAGAVTPVKAGMTLPKLSASKLKDLSWSLDVKNTIK